MKHFLGRHIIIHEERTKFWHLDKLPGQVFYLHGTDRHAVVQEVRQWLIDQDGDAEMGSKFGHPYVHINDEKLALAFMLRFG